MSKGKSAALVPTEQQPTSLATQTPQPAPGTHLAGDILVPRLYLMQGLSDLVTARKKAQGDFVRSTTEETLGNPDKPLDFIPLKMSNDWVLEKKVGQKFKFQKVEPRTPANDDLPWDFKVGQEEWRRVKRINVFALLPNDVLNFKAEIEKSQKSGDLPDLNLTVMPVVIAFRSTGYQAGKGVATFFAKVADATRYNPNLKCYDYMLPLSATQETNDLGSFYVFGVGKSAKIPDGVRDEAARWHHILNTQEVQVAEEEEEKAPVGHVHTPSANAAAVPF